MTARKTSSLKLRRKANVVRKTKETDIKVSLTIEGQGNTLVSTGIPFFDHMLNSMAKHAQFDLELKCYGDLEVDYHHTVEDCGIVLGQALREALSVKRGIRRFGFSYVPMDETLVRCVVDLSGRAFLQYNVKTRKLYAGDFPVQLLEEFMRAFANNLLANVHVELLYGRDAHHIVEASFKALGKALDMACQIDPRNLNIPSTKGSL